MTVFCITVPTISLHFLVDEFDAAIHGRCRNSTCPSNFVVDSAVGVDMLQSDCMYASG